MDEIYLDFLKTPPTQYQHVGRTSSPFAYNELDVKFGIKKYDPKKFKLAQRIAKVDDMVQENDKLKSQINELHQKLKDFQVTSLQVQELYTEEKHKHSTLKQSFENLKKEYNKIDVGLTSMSMVNDQLKARLAEYDGRPINFNNLVVKYVSIMNKLKGEDILKYSPDKDLVERLKEYCAAIRLKIPIANSPKKSKPRGNKIKTHEMFVQCNLLEETSLQKHECLRCKNEPKLQDQSTQYYMAKRDQGCQYISTMITRQTNTEKIVQKHVQTMFPELPAVDDILKVYSRWSDIRSVSPLLESPPPICNKPFQILKKFSTSGTCTMLCNIRRKIDYLSVNNSSNIKQELFTPSASPTLTSYPITTSRSKDSSISINVPDHLNPSSKVNLFNYSTNSSLGQLPSDAFNELWQIFGKMLLSLLQNSNAGIANTIQTSTLNQQQFLDWLLDLFKNSQPQTTSTAQTQTMEQTVPSDSNVSTSPLLLFNDTSVLLTNVVRPLPQKTLIAKKNDRANEVNECLRSNFIDNNSTSTTNTSNFPLQSFSQDSNSMDREVQQIHITSNKTDLQTKNPCDSTLLEIPRINTSKEHSKSSNKPKTKHKILDQIQELLPEMKLNKKKRKALKRMLKNNNHRKKSFETRNDIIENDVNKESSSVVILPNENNNDTIETAVDFLKTFALAQESTLLREENYSETEKIFIKQITNENFLNNVSNIYKAEDFSFIKPSSSLSHSHPSSYINRDTFVKQPIVSTKSKDTNYIENKYQLLFGDSDSELEEHETEIGNFNRNFNSVIKSTANARSENSKYNVNECSESINGKSWALDDTQDWAGQATNQQSFLKVKSSESTNIPVDKNVYETCPKILGNIPQQQFSSTNRPNAIVENLYNRDSSQEMLSRSGLSKSIINDIQCQYPSDLYHFKNMKDSNYFHTDTKKESLNKMNNCLDADIENSLENDLYLSSDEHSVTEFDQDASKTNRTLNTEAKLTKEDVTIHGLKSVNIHIKQNDRKLNSLSFDQTEIIKTDEFYTTAAPMLKDCSVTKINEVFATTNKTSNVEYKLNKEDVTVQELKDNDRKSNFPDFDRSEIIKTDDLYTTAVSTLEDCLVKKDKYLDEINIQSLPNLVDAKNFSNNSLDSYHQVAAPIYSNDFENDFELSSDNESLISDNDSTDTKGINLAITIDRSKNYEICEEIQTFNSNCISSSENDSPGNQQVSLIQMKTVKSKQQKNNQLSNWEESFKSFAFNFSNKSKDNFEEKIKPENGSISILSPETNSSISSRSESISNDSFERQTDKIQKQKDIALQIVEESINILDSISESEDVCPNQTKELNKRHKTDAFNNLQSHLPKNESTNQSTSEENSIIGSIITVSDLSLNDLTSDSKELFKARERNKIVPKISGLSHLKLLDCNSMKKTKATKEVTALRNNRNTALDFKEENNINLPNDIPIVNLEHETIPYFFSTQVKFSDTNNTDDDIKRLAHHQDLIKANKNDVEKDKDQKVIKINEVTSISVYESYKEKESLRKTSTHTETICNMSHENHLNDKVNNSKEINSSLRNPVILNMEPNSINKLTSYDSVDKVDQIDLSDNLSIENELTIDEEANDNNSKELENVEFNKSIILIESEETCNDSTNSTNMSTLLNSSLYNDVLSESIKPIVDDLLMEEELNMLLTQKPKRGRKRKIECLAEVQPCKRSPRIKAKQMLLEESLNLSETPIELGKYTKGFKNIIKNVQLKSSIKEDSKCETIQTSKLLETENTLQMGFFKERYIEEEVTPEHHKICTVTKTQKPEVSNEKIFITYNVAEEPQKQEHQSQHSFESEHSESCHKYKDEKQSRSQNDYIGAKPLKNCIYSDSPQSPAPLETNNEHVAEIPIERLPQFMPQDTNQCLFDVLINSYKNENHIQILQSVTTKEHKLQEYILNQFKEQLKLYCYSETELDLYCASTSVINKLLSISPDYNLVQKAVLTIAKNAEGTKIPENELPSVIHDMPPQHLSKCLQRIFAFLKNVITRNSNFCKDLAHKIESLLFSSKQMEKLSLQATLNLTQLYLMACKVQEYLQLPTHPARLFIAKCLYFYLKKSVLMIHEVLMWYPTVLPHREDKTYDRSDALIIIIQHILMNTKYDVFNPDFRGKTLLSKLRYEYHFEPYKPSLQEVIKVLVEKLKNSKFYNICLAFGLLGKRIGVSTTQDTLLIQHLLPLANEYYSLALQTNEYDKRIGVLLEIISMLVKPLPIETDIQKYFNEFARFLNRFERQPIQEAALCSILRLQRFNVEYCYYLLRHFQPTYILSSQTQAMLKTFLYRRPLTFWKNLKDA